LATLAIDSKTRHLDKFSPHAMAQVKSLQFVDAELERLKATMAVFQTARMGYINALKPHLAGLRDICATLQ
jgi:hypothetical protein